MQINNIVKLMRNIIDSDVLKISRIEKEKSKTRFFFIIIFFYVVCALIYGLFFESNHVDATKVSAIKLFNQKKEKYQNNYYDVHNYYGICRDIEYIGGFSKFVKDVRLENVDEYNNIKAEDKFIALYRDKDTNEILKGDLNDDYIMAGTIKAGINRTMVPNERGTKKGFQEYILKWTGGIIYNDYDGIFSKNYGVEYNKYIYNMPIDYIVDANWNKNIEYTKEDVINISTISEVKCNTYNYLSGKLSNKEYILNILRNCFGYIGDNFYDLVNNNNRFYQIVNDKRIEESEYLPTKIRLGDIGIHDSEKGEQIGICVGYDNKKNPVFSICLGLDEIEKYNNKIVKRKENFNLSGYNILFVDKNDGFFQSYYKTNLPFNDIDNSDYFDNKDLIIDNIDIFNNQISRVNEEEASDIVYKERIKRIILREENALKCRKKNNIDLNKYKNIQFDIIDDIYNLNTNAYNKFVYGSEFNFDTEGNYLKEKKDMKEIYGKRLEEDKRYFINKLDSYYEEIKHMSVDEIIVFLKEQGITLNEFGNEILKDYYNKRILSNLNE